MTDVPSIFILLYSRADMAPAGDAVLSALDADSALAPQSFGAHEPYEVPSSRAELLELWKTQVRAGRGLGGERKRPNSVILSILFGFKPAHPFHFLSWTIDADNHGRFVAMPRIEALFRRLAVAAHAWYGFATHSDEYDRQNVKPTPSGSFRVLGLHPHLALPGLYWLNYFGPEYTRFIGADHLRAPDLDPPAEPLGDGMLLKLAPSPLDLPAPAAIERTESIKRRIGADLFFDIAHPDRVTRAPFVPIPAPRDIPPPPGIDIDLPGMPDASRFIATAAERAADWRRRHGFAVPGKPTFQEARAVLRKVEEELDPGLPEIHPEAIVADTTAVLGQMIIARLGGRWELASAPDADTDGAADVRVVTGRGEIVDPMRRILKRTGDPDAHLYWWYHALVTGTLPPPLTPERRPIGAPPPKARR